MSSEKKEFIERVVNNICRLSRLIFNITNDENLVVVFGLDKSAIELTIEKIVDQFDHNFFSSLNSNQLREIENILAKEFIFFQVQEKESGNSYQAHLKHFKEIFHRDILRRFKINNKSHARMKEE